VNTTEYLERIKVVLLQQITIPSFLKSRGHDDKLGFIFESLFIGLTLAMFISSLWNQVTSSMNLRNVWNDLAFRGDELQNLIKSSKQILTILMTLPEKKRKGCKRILDEGTSVLEACTHLEGLNHVSTFGTVWNSSKCIERLKSWIGKIDVCVAISGMPDICFPRIVRHTSLEISGVIHPVCKPCVSNNFVSNSHVILTGPNRGGKSTFCKSLGLAVVTAQSWGFAWAQRMTWSPFTSIRTALEPYGKLGLYSTFEAEIDFAKSVLETSGHPSFVMMDEIFHSTNATDGVAASSVFLSKLYAKPHTISIISTHYRQLAEQFSRTASPLYMVAEDAEHGKLVYSYKVAHGISDKSSVMEILYERGLLDPVAVNTAI
jgi:DNA mismatch repair ATPase MutS